MSDTVIAPRYQMRYEQLVNTPVLDRIPYFHDREIEYILEVSKAEAEKRAADAEAQVRQWQTWGIVEIAVRNRSVADYMKHWEARALKAKAEAQVKALSRPLQELARASAKEICECFDIKVPRGVSYFNGILGTMAIIIETHLRGQSRDALIAARLSSAKEKP